MAQGLPDPHRLAHFQYELGMALRKCEKYVEAVEHLSAAIEQFGRNASIPALGHAYYELALCRWWLGDPDQARIDLAAARAHFDVAGLEDSTLMADERRALWLHRLEEYSEAADLNRWLVYSSSGQARYRARNRLAENWIRLELFNDALLELEGDSAEHETDLIGTPDWYWRQALKVRCHWGENREWDAFQIARVCFEVGLDGCPSEAVRAVLHEAVARQNGDPIEFGKAAHLYLLSGLADFARAAMDRFSAVVATD